MVDGDDPEKRGEFCAEALQAAYRDRADHTARHAGHCVTLAAVAPTSIAGELIDQAIALRAALRKGLPLQFGTSNYDDRQIVDVPRGD